MRNSETMFGKLDSPFAEKALDGPHHKSDSVGRQPRSRLTHSRLICSKVEARFIWQEAGSASVERLRLRQTCDIGKDEPPYGIVFLSRFRKKIGLGRLMRIVDGAIEKRVE